MMAEDKDAGTYRVCPDCGAEAPMDAPFCAACGHSFLESPGDG